MKKNVYGDYRKIEIKEETRDAQIREKLIELIQGIDFTEIKPDWRTFKVFYHEYMYGYPPDGKSTIAIKFSEIEQGAENEQLDQDGDGAYFDERIQELQEYHDREWTDERMDGANGRNERKRVTGNALEVIKEQRKEIKMLTDMLRAWEKMWAYR